MSEGRGKGKGVGTPGRGRRETDEADMVDAAPGAT